MNRPLFALLLILLVGCASKGDRRQGRREPLRYPSVRDAIERCERAGRPTIDADGQVVPPNTARTQTDCDAAMLAAESAVSQSPGDSEAAALVILALSATQDRGTARVANAKGKERKYCPLSEPWFRDRYRDTGAPDEAFHLHCPVLARRAYTAAVSGERSLTGTFEGFASGDYPRLLLLDRGGKRRELWCLRGCAPFDANESAYRGKRIKVYLIREKTNLSELGSLVERDVYLRGSVQSTAP